MASEYNLALKATLDTSQVQQELQRLKHSYTAGSDDGNSFSKGAPGAAHMQKIEVQLTKLNSAISGLQRSIEQLAKQQQRQSGTQGAARDSTSNNRLPFAPQQFKPGNVSNNELYRAWLGSKEYKDLVKDFNRLAKASMNQVDIDRLHERFGSGPDWVHNAIKEFGLSPDYGPKDYNRELKKWYSDRRVAEQAKQQRAAVR